MNRTTNADWYTMRLKEAEADLGKIKTRIFQVSMLRLVLFVAGVVSVFLFFVGDIPCRKKVGDD